MNTKEKNSIVLQRTGNGAYFDTGGNDALCRNQVWTGFHRTARYIRVTVGTRAVTGSRPIRMWTEPLLGSYPSSVVVRWDYPSRRRRTVVKAVYPFASGWLLDRFKIGERPRTLHVKIDRATEAEYLKDRRTG